METAVEKLVDWESQINQWTGRRIYTWARIDKEIKGKGRAWEDNWAHLFPDLLAKLFEPRRKMYVSLKDFHVEIAKQKTLLLRLI